MDQHSHAILKQIGAGQAGSKAWSCWVELGLYDNRVMRGALALVQLLY